MDLARLRQILGPFIEALKDLETRETWEFVREAGSTES